MGFPPAIILGVIFALESPWWLVRVGREEDATKVVKRLMSKKERTDENAVNKTILAMKLTNEHEKALSAGHKLLGLFQGH